MYTIYTIEKDERMIAQDGFRTKAEAQAFLRFMREEEFDPRILWVEPASAMAESQYGRAA